MTSPIDEPLPVLSAQQATAVRFIWTYFQAHQHYPTVREIGDAMGLKGRNASPYVMALEKKGFVRREVGLSTRNIRLTPLALRWLAHPQAASKSQFAV
jgi:DNA-binding MarR family transcriptional regulator